MKRAIIIGCPGSGKSTFARALRQKTGLPLHYLDQMNWNADRTTVPDEVFEARLQEVLRGSEWIIDGNYASTIGVRLQACDTVFFFDIPVEDCLAGVEARRGLKREEIPWIETSVDEKFLQFIRNYPQNNRPQVLRLLESCPDKTVIVFRSRQDAADYLAGL